MRLKLLKRKPPPAVCPKVEDPFAPVTYDELRKAVMSKSLEELEEICKTQEIILWTRGDDIDRVRKWVYEYARPSAIDTGAYRVNRGDTSCHPDQQTHGEGGGGSGAAAGAGGSRRDRQIGPPKVRRTQLENPQRRAIVPMAERDEFSIRVNDTVLHRRTAGGPGTAAWIVARGAATSDDATPWPEARGWDGEGAATTIELVPAPVSEQGDDPYPMLRPVWGRYALQHGEVHNKRPVYSSEDGTYVLYFDMVETHRLLTWTGAIGEWTVSERRDFGSHIALLTAPTYELLPERIEADLVWITTDEHRTHWVDVSYRVAVRPCEDSPLPTPPPL